MIYSNDTTVPTPIFHKHHFTIKQVNDETERCSDYQLSITSPQGFTYYFFADFENPIDSIVNEAMEFDALEYYVYLLNHYGRDPFDYDLIDEACWTKKQIVDLSEDLLAWRNAKRKE